MINKNDAEKNNINVIETDNILIDAKKERIEQIKALLPNVINSDNQIDLKALHDLVGSENTTSNNQGYELTFAGKGLARAKADAPTTKELKAELGQSKDFDTTENVIIRGDNIDSLKILRANYHNKIKMIYIDPPYNTKSENFIYRDNFKQTDAKLIKDFGLNEDTTNFLDNVYGTRSHSGWLSFMYPRLMLAKDLLRDDGVIFISIDDNEQANLKILCDEIFGADNFIGTFPWRKRTAKSDVPFGISQDYEWIIGYANNTFLAGISVNRKYHKTNDYDSRWRLSDLTKQSSKDERPNSFFTMTNPKNGKTYPAKPNRVWAVTKDTFDDYYKKGKIVFPDDYDFLKIASPSYRVFEEEDIAKNIKKFGSEKPLKAISTHLPSCVGMTEDGTKEINEIFPEKTFSFPKPSTLLRYFIEVAKDDNSIILDFFAGSGTTAHAVMEQNALDGGNRKFILCQLDEEIDPKKSKPAYDFCENHEPPLEPVISSITIERVNRAGDKIKAAPENEGKNIDIGYKVFSHADKPKIDYDNAQKSFNILNQRANTIDTIFNMLVATCKTLDIKIETIRENAIYKADNEIYVVNKITPEELEPFKDLKINIDALADIDLKDYLNLDLSFRDNMTVIY